MNPGNVCALIALLAACTESPRPDDPTAATFATDFEPRDALAAFEFTDAAAWRIVDDRSRVLDLFAASHYQPPHRSPLNIALLRAPAFGDFILEVQARQTGPEYPHRDLVIVFAWRDPAHFAYAHLASTADDNAHQIMLVDGADRRPFTTGRSQGVAWGEGWHTVRVVRRAQLVSVFFDGSEHAVLAGQVPTWRGRIGLGSFDDTGRFDELRVWAR